MWPWRRRTASGTAPEPARLPVSRAEWRQLPPIQRAVPDHPLVNPAQRFAGSLSSWRNPSFLAPLGHRVGPAEPAGLIADLAHPAPAPDLPVVSRHSHDAQQPAWSRLWSAAVAAVRPATVQRTEPSPVSHPPANGMAVQRTATADLMPAPAPRTGEQPPVEVGAFGEAQPPIEAEPHDAPVIVVAPEGNPVGQPHPEPVEPELDAGPDLAAVERHGVTGPAVQLPTLGAEIAASHGPADQGTGPTGTGARPSPVIQRSTTPQAPADHSAVPPGTAERRTVRHSSAAHGSPPPGSAQTGSAQAGSAQTGPAQPAAAHSTAVEPVAVQPVSVQSAVVEPVAVQPVSVQPATVKPDTVHPVSVQPAMVEPAAVQPAVIEPAIVHPVTAQPVTVQAAMVEPVNVQPATVQPVTVQPAMVEPATVQPVAVQPATVQPVAVQPVTVRPETVQTAAVLRDPARPDVGGHGVVQRNIDQRGTLERATAAEPLTSGGDPEPVGGKPPPPAGPAPVPLVQRSAVPPPAVPPAANAELAERPRETGLPVQRADRPPRRLGLGVPIIPAAQTPPAAKPEPAEHEGAEEPDAPLAGELPISPVQRAEQPTQESDQPLLHAVKGAPTPPAAIPAEPSVQVARLVGDRPQLITAHRPAQMRHAALQPHRAGDEPGISPEPSGADYPRPAPVVSRIVAGQAAAPVPLPVATGAPAGNGNPVAVRPFEPASVPVLQRQEAAAQPEPAPAEPVPPSTANTGAAAPAGAPATAAEPEELLKKLFDPLLRRLKAELRLDRERRGALTDLRH